MEIKISEIQDIESIGSECPHWLFRGHSDVDWDLKTSLERAAGRCAIEISEYETQITREFKRHAHTFLNRVPNDIDTLEWLSIMQHYGAPTRLLDFTRSLWIAIFFALEQADKNFCVWAVDPTKLGIRDGLDFNNKLNDQIFFTGSPEDKIYQDVPYYTHERLSLQQGTFLFSMNIKKNFHELFISNQKRYRKYVFNKSLRPQLLRKLNEVNCNSRILFPGMDGYARYYQNHTLENTNQNHNSYSH